MTILNTTPHNVCVLNTTGGETVFPKSTCQIRATASEEKIREEAGFDIYQESLGALIVDDPNDMMHNADVLIMSRIAASKAKEIKSYEKYKIWIPGGLIRDPMGAVIGCKGFIEV